MSLTIYETYIHNDASIITITDLLNKENTPFSSFKDDKEGFLNYDGNTDVSNLDRIYSKYTAQEQEDNVKDTSIELLKMNTELITPKDLLAKELISISSKNQFLEQKDFKAFAGESLLQLLSDPLYIPNDKYRFNDGEALTTIFPNISVWIYIGALDEIINVSPYVMNCSIAVTKDGGSFNIGLPPVISIDEEDVYFQSINERHDFFYSDSSIDDGKEFYFHKYIQANDIVFIKFEQLELEKNDASLKEFMLSKSVLSGQIYDMIGLVDTNNKTVSYGSNEVSISIAGRDFMKLLIDDGSYFFPLLFTAGLENNFVNIGKDDKFIKRVFTTGNYNTLFAYSFRSISETIKFIVNQLANLGVVGEDVDLFSSYGKRRSRVFRLENQKASEFKDELHTGVWQIIKILVDANVADRRVADPSISQPDGSLIVQFQKICQEPFVEFFGDTYGDFYNFIVRQPPYTKSQILSFVNGVVVDDNDIKGQKEGLDTASLKKATSVSGKKSDLTLTIEPEDVISEDLTWESEQIYSWYELKPQGAFLGNQSNIALAYLPIMFFPQYANKWGNRRLSHISNYISYQAFTGAGTDTNKDLFREAIINDYKYMIDAHVYLPFTRKGTITINGDRRFKRGTWIRHGKSSEIYYIDAVSNSFLINNGTIDRTTTLTVSRGMVEKYTKGSITYFDIVDTDFIKKILIESIQKGETIQKKPKTSIQSNYGVNQDVFDFFYNRQQFDNSII